MASSRTNLYAARYHLIPAIFGLWFASSEKDISHDYCEEDTFAAKCSNNEVILIQSARYGRMRPGTCLTSQYGSFGCSSNLVGDLDFVCSGQPSCSLGVRELIHRNPCPRELRGYLEAQYSCIKVVVPANRTCRQQTTLSVRQTTTGYLSSYVAEQTGCGGFDAPWQILAAPGQRINVTLWNFGLPRFAQREAENSAVCQVLAVITDKAMSETVCAGTSRVSAVFLSTSNELQVRMVVKGRKEATNEGKYFLLSYEVIGCPNVFVSPGAWFKRISSNEGVFGCTEGFDTWRLVCENNAWTGFHGNCSEGMNVTIMATVATAIGLFVVIGGLIIVRRQFPKSDLYVDGGDTLDPRCSASGGDNESLPVLPKTALPVHVLRNVSYSSRTWDLQQQQQQRQPEFRVTASSSTCPGSSPTIYRMRVIEESPPRYVEHIYESPKSVRREIDAGEARKDKEPVTQYYEIDSRLTKPQPTPDLYQMTP